MRTPCPKCVGTGNLGGGWRRVRTCDVCGGTGYVEQDNVVRLPCMTRLDMDTDDVLRAAIGELDTVVICGYTKDGAEYFASNVANGPDVLWLLQRSGLNLLTIGDKDE